MEKEALTEILTRALEDVNNVGSGLSQFGSDPLKYAANNLEHVIKVLKSGVELK